MKFEENGVDRCNIKIAQEGAQVVDRVSEPVGAGTNEGQLGKERDLR